MTAAFLVLSVLAAVAPVRVAGRVTDPTGAPVAAAIHAASADGPIVGRSDARGTFALEADPLPADGIVVVAPGFAAERVADVDLGGRRSSRWRRVGLRGVVLSHARILLKFPR